MTNQLPSDGPQILICVPNHSLTSEVSFSVSQTRWRIRTRAFSRLTILFVLAILSIAMMDQVGAQEWRLRHAIEPTAERVFDASPGSPGGFGFQSWSGVVAGNRAALNFRWANDLQGAVLVFDTLNGEQLSTLNSDKAGLSGEIGDYVTTNGDLVATDGHYERRDVQVFASESGDLVHRLTPSQFGVRKLWIASGTSAMNSSTLVLQSDPDPGDSQAVIFVDLATGKERFRVNEGYGPSNPGQPAVYLRDDVALLAGYRETTDAVVVDVNTGNELQRLSLPEELHGQLMWPGLSGDKAFVYAWEDKTTFVFDLQTGNEINRYELVSDSTKMNLAFSDEFIVTRKNHDVDGQCAAVDVAILAADTSDEVYSTSLSTPSSQACGWGIGIQGNVAVVSVGSSDLNGIDVGPLFVFQFGNELLGDFSENGMLDVADIDLLSAEIQSGNHSLLYDLDNDGTMSAGDLSAWVGSLADTWIGDTNLDGKVDAVDLDNLAQNWQQEINLWFGGDFNADGTVDAADLNQLGQNWLRSTPSAAVNHAVPEPSALRLVFAGVALIFLRQR